MEVLDIASYYAQVELDIFSFSSILCTYVWSTFLNRAEARAKYLEANRMRGGKILSAAAPGEYISLKREWTLPPQP